MLKINRIFLWVLLATHLPFFYAAFYLDPNGYVDVDYPIFSALWLHFICVACFVFGYFLIYPYLSKREAIAVYVFKRSGVKTLIFFSMLGVFVTIFQIAQTLSLGDYFSNLISGELGEGLRNAYLLDSEDGGLPGYVKMFHNAPLAVFLFAFSIYLNLKMDDCSRKRLQVVLLLSFVCVLFKTLLSLDRISILALMLCYFYYGASRGFKLSNIVLLVLLLGAANFISANRLQGYDVLDFLFLYMKLGLINLQLIMNESLHHTYGFQTFFHFSNYIAPGVISNLGIEFQKYSWHWNPALYFVSYGFLDFWYFIVPIYLILGSFAALLDAGIKKNKNILMCSIYFILLYGFASFFTVPVIRGVEYFLAILLSSIFGLLYIKKG